jgi:SNF2 family DNA or RNA helicase
MAKPRMEVRVGNAGNGTPVFLVHGQNRNYERVFGATWDAARALWMYPAFYPASEKVLSDFDAISDVIDVDLSDVARRHVQSLAKVKARLEARELPSDFDFVTKPYECQIEGLCHVYYNLRAALFFDPGLGKTKIAIDLMRLLRRDGSKGCALVIGPRVTVQNWGREIDRHSGRQLSWIALTGTPAQKRKAIERAANEQVDMVLVTYGTARRIVDLLVNQLPYEVLVCDESHNVKSWRSDQTKATWEIAQKAKRRVLMTGSPTEGNTLDAYAPFKILGDCFMPEDYWRYQKKFVEKASAVSPIVVGYKNLDVVNERITFLSLRRTKEQCLDLPPRTFVDVDYTLSSLQIEAYDQIVLEMGIDPTRFHAFVEAARNNPQEAQALLPALPPEMEMPHRAAALVKLLQITSGFIVKNEKDPFFCDTVRNGGPCEHLRTCVEDKIKPRTPACHVDKTPWPSSTTFFEKNPKHDAIMELIDNILAAPGTKAIVWCVFHAEMDSIMQRLTERGIGHVRVDGKTRDPMAAIDLFNDDPSIRVYVGQVASGVGINLVAASYVIYSSLPYSLTTYAQCLDRNYRIGQTKPVTVYRMIGESTLESAVAYLLDHKVDVDALLTNKIECALCPNSLTCLTSGIEPFEKGCIHPKRVTRPVVKARALKVYPGDES